LIHSISTHSVPRFEAEEGGFELWIAGDKQVGSEGYVKEAWQDFRTAFKRSKRKKAFLGLGDYCDWLRPSLRPLLRGALGKDDSARKMLDGMILKQHDEAIDDMEFLKGHCIGLHEGHHNWTTLDGINLDQRMSSALKTTFLGFAAATRLNLIPSYNTGVPAQGGYTVTMLSTHGNANGRKVAGALTWAENNLANAFVADLYVIGHGCKSGNSAPFERNEIRRQGPAGIKRTLPRILAVGGFCRGWTDGWKSDYVEQAGMSPQPLGYGKITFRLVNRKANTEAVGGFGAKTKVLDIDVVNKLYDEGERE
jgi:hypothetical protein